MENRSINAATYIAFAFSVALGLADVNPHLQSRRNRSALQCCAMQTSLGYNPFPKRNCSTCPTELSAVGIYNYIIAKMFRSVKISF